MPLSTANLTPSPNLSAYPNQSRPGGTAAPSLKPAIAFLLLDLHGGGVQKMVLLVAGALAKRGYPVTLLAYSAQGPLREQLPTEVRLVELKASPGWLARLYALVADPVGFKALLRPVILPRKTFKTLNYLPDLVRYLRRERPAALFAAMSNINIEAVLARRLAGAPTRIVISERTHISRWITMGSEWRRRFLPPLMRHTYLQAEAIVSVSNGVADDLATAVGLPRERIVTIYNPTVHPELLTQARAPLEHPWFTAGAPPVVLGVGRLGRSKDFTTLIKAFARLRTERPVRLLILGGTDKANKWDERRGQLMALAAGLGVTADDVLLQGFVPNPFAYMARAAVFVLSSLYEGFPNVLVEALACGCPVVSTDCRSGPAEILDHGRFGPLVPVGDDLAMAQAIGAVLDAPTDPHRLQARAALFSYEQAIDSYEAILLGKE